ncbi:hypothetical protein AUJ14_00205 [Candidatus Micrarchaeota archaeon CG1_02_55_22]|nr:MAG: hypothetical protein AUJ14_00205 [Candidatus Micrarchaeota archaeon CG1_02_55_22]
MPVEAVELLQTALRMDYTFGTRSFGSRQPRSEYWPEMGRFVFGLNSFQLVHEGHNLLRGLLSKGDFSAYSRAVAEQVRVSPESLSFSQVLGKQGRALRGFNTARLDSRSEWLFLKRAEGALVAKERVSDALVLARNECQRSYHKQVSGLLNKACKAVVLARSKQGSFVGYQTKFHAGGIVDGVAVPSAWSIYFFKKPRTGKR